MIAETKGLADHARQRARHTVERVRGAIAALQARGETVSLRGIADETGRQASDGVRVATSTIAHNADAYALYEAARTALRRSRVKGPRVPHLERLTKAQLIARYRKLQAEKRFIEQALARALGMEPR